MRHLILIWLSIVTALAANTTVTSTVQDPLGGLASGHAFIGLTTGCTLGNNNYVSASRSVTYFTSGNFSVSLVPTDACVTSGAVPSGAWSSVTSYVAGNVVSYNGQAWAAIASSTNVLPGTNAADWTLVSPSYQVQWTLTSGQSWTETWIVPTSGSPLTVQSVRVATAGLPSVVLGIPTLGGDVSGPAAAAKVIGLEGRAVATTLPTNNQVLAWNNGASQWQPMTPSATTPGGSSGNLEYNTGSGFGGFLFDPTSDISMGSISGSPATSVITVTKLEGNALSTAAPAAGNVLTWTGSPAKWTPAAPATAAGGNSGNLEYNAGGSPAILGGFSFASTGLVNGGDMTLGTISGSPATAKATITGLQTYPVSSTAPTSGQLLAYNLTGCTGNPCWLPTNPSSASAGGATNSLQYNTGSGFGGFTITDNGSQNGGDMSLSTPSGSPATAKATVTGLQGYPVSNTAPTNGYALAYNTGCSCWVATQFTGSAAGSSGQIQYNNGASLAGFSFASTEGPHVGDVSLSISGTTGTATVTGLQGRPVSTAVPSAPGQVLYWSGSTWGPANITVSNANQLQFSPDGVQLAGFTLGGDATIQAGPSQAIWPMTVNGWLGRPLSTTPPQPGQVYAWNSTGNGNWVPTTFTGVPSGTSNQVQYNNGGTAFGGFSFGQDLSLSLPTGNATVIGIEGKAISAAPTANGQVLQYNGTQWVPTVLSGSGGNITSVFGRTGVVAAQSGDYTMNQIGGINGSASTTTVLYGLDGGSGCGGGGCPIWQAIPAPANLLGGLLGSIPYQSAANTTGMLAGNTASDDRVLVSHGSASLATAPTLSNAPALSATNMTTFPATLSNGSTVSITGNAATATTASALTGGLPTLLNSCNSPATGNVIYYNGTNWVCLGANSGSTNWLQENSSGTPSWTTPPGSGGGASIANQLTDLQTLVATTTTLTVGANCTNSSPCNVRFGSQTWNIASSATLTISAGTGTVYIYVNTSGQIIAGYNGITMSCSAGCTAQSGISGFPINTIPLWTWTANNTPGQWDAAGGSDKRAFESAKVLTNGTGISISETLGQTTVAVDTTVVPTFASGTSTPGSCTPASFFYNTTQQTLYTCSGVTYNAAGFAWPASPGLANYNGSQAWGTSYTVGGGANNIPQLDGSANLTINGSGSLGTLTTTSTSLKIQETGSGTGSLTLNGTGGTFSGTSTASQFIYGTLYSVAGNTLPACVSGTLGVHTEVSDATVAMPGSAYAGGGTYTIGVQCIFNSIGSVYTWIID